MLLEDLGPSPLWSLAPRPVERLRAQLERAAEDPRVRAVVLRIDSPRRRGQQPPTRCGTWCARFGSAPAGPWS
ncbi:MAG: hypothetical protein KatS3mg102_0756 [Planctomycetota bacterium]|nr:MAG: hypothetical protein KatS3mg102_0756 [Planctomycetota bacterium]